ESAYGLAGRGPAVVRTARRGMPGLLTHRERRPVRRWGPRRTDRLDRGTAADLAVPATVRLVAGRRVHRPARLVHVTGVFVRRVGGDHVVASERAAGLVDRPRVPPRGGFTHGVDGAIHDVTAGRGIRSH